MKSVWENLRGLFERLVGLLALVVFLPTLLLLAIFLRTNSDEPVLLTDLFVGRAGRPVRSYRFRTTGRGTSAFRVVVGSCGCILWTSYLDSWPWYAGSADSWIS